MEPIKSAVLVVLLALFTSSIAAAGGKAPGSPPAAISLSAAGVTLTQTSDTTWTLSKTGTVDTSASTVTWQITATPKATIAGQLIVNGEMAVTNSGAGGATIGNIVVNLQTKSGSNWITESSDIADATHGDAATTANIDSHASSEGRSSFTENAASGSLQFMDAHSNTTFSLVPEVTIAPGKTVTLLFSAVFDNNQLHLTTRSAVRIESIISFGNASHGASSTANVDINGNGMIDPDEAEVHSVPSRVGVNVPAQIAGNSTVTLGDSAANIAATGDVTFSNVVVHLGATTGTVTASYTVGTVTASYTVGTGGGSLTNCATATSPSTTVTSGTGHFIVVPGVNLQACDTETIGGVSVCTPGAPGCGWQDGDETSHSQVNWDTTDSPVLLSGYSTAFPSGTVEIGIDGTAGFSITFDSPIAITSYLPQLGAPGPLTSDLFDPTTSSSGAFGGDTLALTVNVAYSDANVLARGTTLAFGDLTVCGLTLQPAFDGMRVRDVLAAANVYLGVGTSSILPDAFESLLAELNSAFDGGVPSVFAQQSLVAGLCP